MMTLAEATKWLRTDSQHRRAIIQEELTPKWVVEIDKEMTLRGNAAIDVLLDFAELSIK
jgi:hypothetical protein